MQTQTYSDKADHKSKYKSIFYKTAGILPVAFFIAACLYLTSNSSELAGGKFIYSLDDAYIHLSIAKNTVDHGVFGVSKYAYSAASSSPLWTSALITGAYIVGTDSLEFLPIILNVIIGSCLLWILYYETAVKRKLLHPVAACIACLALVPWSSAEALSGMEHLAHALFALLFISAFIEIIIESRPRVKSWAKICFLMFCVSGLRFEGLYLALAAAAVSAYYRKYSLSALLIVSAGIPVVVTGLISLSNGSMFLPSSIVLKSALSGKNNSNLLQPFYSALKSFHLIPVCAVLILGLIVSGVKKIKDEGTMGGAIPVLSGILLSLQFSLTVAGQYYRYSFWLAVLGLFASALFVGFGYKKLAGKKLFIAVTAALTGIACIAFAAISRETFALSLKAPENIYCQQYQTAKFMSEYYSGEPVLINDIGAVNYFADTRNYDLAGLGTIEIAKAIAAGSMDKEFIERFVREKQIKAIAIFDNWYVSIIPKSWVPVARWVLPNNVICGSPMLCFWAPDSVSANILKTNLQNFRSLPHSVQYWDTDWDKEPELHGGSR